MENKIPFSPFSVDVLMAPWGPQAYALSSYHQCCSSTSSSGLASHQNSSVLLPHPLVLLCHKIIHVTKEGLMKVAFNSNLRCCS